MSEQGLMAKTVVKCAVMAKLDKTATLDKTLSGRGIGLEGLKPTYERGIEEQDGYYAGIREQFDNMKATGELEFSVRLVPNTTFFLGKEGQFLVVQIAIGLPDDSVIVDSKYFSQIKMCTPEEESKGGFRIPVSTVLCDDPIITVGG